MDAFSDLPATFAGGAFLFGFDRFPVAQHFGGVAGFGVAKNMRMPSHHFGVHFVNHVVDVEFAAFARDAREESNLE